MPLTISKAQKVTCLMSFCMANKSTPYWSVYDRSKSIINELDHPCCRIYRICINIPIWGRTYIYEWVRALCGTIVVESAPLFVDQLRHGVTKWTTKWTPLYNSTEISSSVATINRKSSEIGFSPLCVVLTGFSPLCIVLTEFPPLCIVLTRAAHWQKADLLCAQLSGRWEPHMRHHLPHVQQKIQIQVYTNTNTKVIVAAGNLICNTIFHI